ncbi:MAG: WG repeat-containing protein [Acidobacteriia bacterium]|nr:WG repeat-containing protein [Terriglobia bacterium]
MNRLRTLCVAAVVFCAAISTSAQSQHFDLPFLISRNDKHGFMDSNCQMVIPAQYSGAFDFTDGLAAVKIGQKWGYIDQTGTVVIPAMFAGAVHFSDGLASVRLDEHSPLWGFIDKTGEVVIKPKFGMPLWFSEGLVEGYGEKNGILNVPLGYVDKSGNYVIRLNEAGMEIEFLVGFSEGLARVSMRPKHPDGSVGPSTWGYIDHSGKWVIPHSFAAGDDFHEGLAAVTGKDGTWGYIDKTGQFVIAPRFETAMDFSEGLAAVRVAGRWGWINKSGQMVILPKFEGEEIGVFRGGMAIIVKNRKLGYINVKGDMVVPPGLNWGTEFTDGVAAVSDSSGYGAIDADGKFKCRLKRE